MEAVSPVYFYVVRIEPQDKEGKAGLEWGFKMNLEDVVRMREATHDNLSTILFYRAYNPEDSAEEFRKNFFAELDSYGKLSDKQKEEFGRFLRGLILAHKSRKLWGS